MDQIDQVAEQIAAKLTARKESVAVAESSAGGLIAAALLRVSGASAYFKGGVVVYNSEAKIRLAGMTQQQIDAGRSSTAPHTELLAAAIQSRLGSTWAIAETGAAGPSGNRYGDAAGHSAIAVAGPHRRSQIIETAESDRAANMQAFALAALSLLNEALGASD